MSSFSLLARGGGQGHVEPSLSSTVLGACWIVLSIAGFLFFHFNRNAPLKRKIVPLYCIAAGIIFTAYFLLLSEGSLIVLLLAVPVTVLFIFLATRMSIFCDSCGRTLYPQPFFARPKFCPHCGGNMP